VQTVTVDEKSIKITYTEKNNIISYSVNDISGIEYNSDHVLVKLKKPRYNHISIPLSAIEKTEQQSFFDMLAKFDQTVA
jgi:DNA-binding LytR/AlgR family response regulator